jgi:hypothetical protein
MIASGRRGRSTIGRNGAVVTLDRWLAELERRHLANLTPAEVGRALRALSSCYVERRDRLADGAALEGAGKRAAFALFYGVQHFLTVREIARALAIIHADRIVDLGCGTGTAGVALALETGCPRLEGFDVSRWAVDEANWTYRAFELRGHAAVRDIRRVRLPAPGVVLAAYSVNELEDGSRRELLSRVLDVQRRGATILVVEPIARRTNRWWNEWSDAFSSAGARDDEWKFRVPLPERAQALARAAGLDVQELKARSLYLQGR